MVNAGASIEAFLKLDATDFNSGIKKASESVKVFKESMVEIGANTGAVKTGIKTLTQALGKLVTHMSLFKNLANEVQNFKTFGQGLEYMATAAQRLSRVSEQGSVGISALQEVIKIWATGVQSAEAPVVNLTAKIRDLGNASKDSATKLSSAQQVMRSQFQLLEATLDPTIGKEEEARAITQRLSKELGLSGRELVNVRNRLLETGMTVDQYIASLNKEVQWAEKVNMSNQKMATSFNTVKTTLQSWKSLTDSIVNTTLQRLPTSTNNITTSIGNLTTGINTTKNAMEILRNTTNGWMGTLNSTDGTIKRATSGVVQYANAIGPRMATQINASRMSVIDLNNVYNRGQMIVRSLSQSMMTLGSQLERNRAINQSVITGEELYFKSIEEVNSAIMQNSNVMRQNAEAKLRAMGYTGRLSAEEERLSVTSNQASSSVQRTSSSMRQATTSANNMARATNTLGRAMSSLRMIGTMVASMMVWNFAHNLITATRETVNAKSEMEGYFKMLHFSQGEVDDFNKALDQTVSRFQRINKYSLGETISSIGVEFNLTTEEMKKAMPVVSMITSEYLRAGRNVNEASLAVKDILQGEFQRLSRETGVKGDQLKEAGWSGDKSDVMGLLEALDKVGKSRNWDVFVTKANSLNDAVLILQNRFGEWSAEMVNVVQPTILAVFNNLMNFGQGLAQSIGGGWEWLNGDSWESLAFRIASVSTALLVGVHSLTAYRTGATLLEVKQMGLTKALGGLILGLKKEELANNGVAQSLSNKLLGLEANTLAEKGYAMAVNETFAKEQMEMLTSETRVGIQKLKNAEMGEGIILHEATATAISLERDAETGAIAIKQGYTLATEGQAVASIGFTEGLQMVVAGEMLAEGETVGLTGAIGMLTGAFLASPIGWFALAILGLASAFYVLTGGLSDTWEKMKEFNDIMKDTGSAQKEAHQWLEQIKNDANATAEEIDNATASVEEFDQKLQSASYWYNHSQTEFNGLDLTISSTSKGVLDDYGISREDAEEWNANLDILHFGKDKYYKAEQVLNKQIKGENSNYAKDLDEYLSKVQKNGGDLEEAYGKMTGNYQNLAYHSYIANTSDDWWEKSWNQLYAGLDQMWIDWDNFWADPQWGSAIDGFFKIIDSRFQTDLGKRFSGDAIVKGLSDMWTGFNEWLADGQEWLRNGLSFLDDWGDEFNKFAEDPLKYLGLDKINVVDTIMDAIFGDTVSASDGSSDHPSFMEDLSDILGFDIQSWIDSFTSDPLGTLGIEPLDLGFLTSVLFGGVGGMVDSTWAFEFINNNIIVPISNTFQNFMADPVAFIGNMGFTISGLLDSLFGTDIFTNVMTWVNNSIIIPFGTAIYNGIMQIPILSDILILLGFTDEAHGTSEQKGKALANAFGTMLCQTIGNIPILGDLLRLLGVIDSQQPNAKEKGQTFGGAIYDGLKAGIGNMVSWATQEFQDIANGIRNKVGEAYSSAQEFGSNLWNGLNSVLKRASPGFIHDQVLAEFGTDIPNAITSSGDVAYTNAQYYGQQIRDGVASATQTNLGLDTMVGDYQTDAQNIAMSSEMMGTTTTTAFNDMTMSVNASTSQMQTNVTGTYSQIQSQQASSLNSMKTQNISAYNDMYLKSNQSLVQMRDSTSNVTNQMTNAWNHMKDNIIASANQLKSQSTSHFNQLSSTIGDFYGKIQNPSRWGSGPSSPSNVATRSPRRSSTGRAVARAFTRRGAGGNLTGGKHTGSPIMTVSQAKRMLCPTGDCGSLFEGYSLSDKIDITDWMANLEGEHGFGWSDWHNPHYNYIRTTSNEWGMKSPRINLVGGIDTDATFKVGEFENGRPNVSFSTFQSIAGSIFSRIPYRMYYDSSWKGSWLGALQAGACNCSDGADALLALASVFGFSGYKQWGKWGNTGHFWAVINGVPMDTTAWQGGYGWTSPKVSGYGPTPRRATPSTTSDDSTVNKTVNITNDFTGATIYGVDDLDDKIQESTRKALREEFNDSYSVVI